MTSSTLLWQRAQASLAALLLASAVAATAAEPPPAAAATPASPSSPAAAASPSDETAALWSKRCAGCHGADGSGPVRKRIGTQVPDLRGAQWQSQHDDSAIRAIIANGVPGKHMPAFKDRLSAEQIAALAGLVHGYKR